MDSDPQQIPYRNKSNSLQFYFIQFLFIVAHQIWIPKSPNNHHLSTSPSPSPSRRSSHRRNRSRNSDIPSDEELEGEAIVYHPNSKHLSKSPQVEAPIATPITNKKSYSYPHVVEPTPIKPESNGKNISTIKIVTNSH